MIIYVDLLCFCFFWQKTSFLAASRQRVLFYGGKFPPIIAAVKILRVVFSFNLD